MVKKIKKNNSYSYNDRNIAPKTKGHVPEKIEQEVPDLTGEDASSIKRIIAYGIDLAIYLPIALLFQYTSRNLRNIGGPENERNALYMMISIIIFAILLYGYLPSNWKGQTIGKKICKIRIVPTDGKKVEFSKYLVREFLVKVVLFWFTIPLVSFYYLYQKFVAREVNPALLHDSLFNTKVVKAQEK